MCLRKWLTSLLSIVLLPSLVMAAPTAVAATGAGEQAQGGAFTLTSRNGPLSLHDLRGKVVLMFFGYTSCPDVCPTTLAVISRVFAGMTPAELQKVTALFVSLDPERDTPELLHKYTQYFHPNIVGVTDSQGTMQQLLQDYAVSYERKERPESPLGYVIFHTPDILVVDRDGKLQPERIPPNTGVQDITAYVRSLL